MCYNMKRRKIMKLPLTAAAGINPSVLMLVCVIVLVVLTTVIVMVVTGRLTQLFMKLQHK